jgi:ABC-type dipeptide/oligopeptide/nickel transport system permease subunit|tara:strand:- start:268 stop:2001 length:1734 start_codon:yes stop_codon:yes gene_type:complete
MSWEDGVEERAESLRRIRESAAQARYDFKRGWKIYRRSLLAVIGLLMVISISVVSIFADDIAVEHPGRNLQDTRDVWHIDYEPRKAAPFSDECDTRYQKVSLTTLRRWDANGTNALSPTRVADNNSFYEDILVVTEFIELQDRYGVTLASDLVTLETSNNSYFWISDELMENNSLTQIRLIYKFENDAMHHWWLPDGYDVCIFGTNDEGQDLFSKILYGSRVSLTIGFTVATLTVIIGTIIGSISGYFGGRTDEVIMRITDIFFAVPGLILALAFVAALQAIDDFTLPLWFAFLLPLSGLCIYFRSTIFDSIMPGETSFPERNLPMRVIVVVSLVVLLALGGPWEYFFELAESSEWRIFASLIGLMIVGGILILDRRLMDNISLDGVGSRTLNSLDWRNPYRYLTFRTLVIFIASIALFTWSGDGDNEITVIDNFDRLWKIQIALVFTGWPGYARLIRGQVLYVKEMTFVEAARSVGAPSGRIMFRHILPNAWAPLLVAFTLDIGGTILSASGLSFIGLGAEPGAAEWGKLVSDGRAHFPQDYWLVLFPGLAIAYTTLGFNLLGDGLRDVVDPKNRR